MTRTHALGARTGEAKLCGTRARGCVTRFVLGVGSGLWGLGVLLAPAPAGAQATDAEPTTAPTDSSAQVNPEFDWEAEYAARLSPKDERLRTLFGDSAYDFCNDPDYVLAVDERPLCAFAEEARARCPELRSACARPVHLDRIDFSWGSGAGTGEGDDGPKTHRRGRSFGKSPTPPPDLSFEIPPWLADIFRGLFWLVLVTGFISILVLLTRNWFSGLAGRGSAQAQAATPEPNQTRGPTHGELVEKDVQRLLARAQAEASRGAFADAVDSVHAALLRYLDGNALIHLGTHKTNGDHVASLSPHPELQGVLRHVTARVEHSQFGHTPPSAQQFSEIFSRVQRLITQSGVLGLLLLLAQPLVCGCSGEGDQSGRAAASHWGVLSDTSVVGFSALAALLQDAHVTASNHVGGPDDIAEDVSALVVYDQTDFQDEDWVRLERWAEEGHLLLIAGDHRGAQHFGVGLWGPLCDRQPNPTGLLPTLAYQHDPETGGLGARLVLPFSALEMSELYAPLVECAGAPLIARRSVGAGEVILLANANAFANASLASADNAALALALLGEQGHVAFAGELVGAGTDSPYEALSDAKLGPLLLQLLLMLLVLYWSRGVIFGRPRSPRAKPRHDFVDHILALGQLYRRRKAKSHALATYSAWALERLFERTRPGARMSVIELSEALAQRTGQSRNAVLTTLVDATSAKTRDANAPPQARDLETLRELESLVIQTGGAK